MPRTTTLAHYPAAYQRILANLPLDGSPISITLADPFEADQARLQFYNFLRFVKRNHAQCAHFDAHVFDVSVSRTDATLSFFLRSRNAEWKARAQGTPASALDEATSHLPLPPEPNLISLDPPRIITGAHPQQESLELDKILEKFYGPNGEAK